MGSQWKKGYMKKIYVRYCKAKSREDKSTILDEFCKTYDCHRKHALRLLNAPPPDEKPPIRRKKPFYTNRVICIVEAVWKASGYPWSKRLKAILALWMTWIQKRFQLTPKELSQSS